MRIYALKLSILYIFLSSIIQNSFCLAPPFLPYGIFGKFKYYGQPLENFMPWYELRRFATQSPPQRHTNYWINQADLREYYMEYSGKSDHRSFNPFKEMLMILHKIAVSGDDGETTYYAYVKDIHILRSEEIINTPHTKESVEVLYMLRELQKRHGIKDKYNLRNTKKILSLDRVPTHMRPSNKGLTHTYPSMQYQDTYFKVLHEIYIELLDLIESSSDMSEEVVMKIAEFHQYAVNFHPFPKVNNSIFMNIVNVMLKKNGWRGIRHGILDYAALRLEPKNYTLLFLDWVKMQNTASSSASTLDKEALINNEQIHSMLTNGKVLVRDEKGAEFRFKYFEVDDEVDHRFCYRIEVYNELNAILGYIDIRDNWIERPFVHYNDSMEVFSEWQRRKIGSKLLELAMQISRDYLSFRNFYIYIYYPHTYKSKNINFFKKYGFKFVSKDCKKVMVFAFDEQAIPEIIIKTNNDSAKSM